MSKLLFSFGVIADCQYADRDNDAGLASDGHHYHDNHFRESPAKLQEAVGFFNQHELEFVVHLGDFVDREIEKNAPVVLPIAAQSQAPFWHVLGNHDYSMREGSEQDILALYGMEAQYYSKSLHGYRFIILNTNEMGTIRHKDNTPELEAGKQYLQHFIDAGKPQAYPWNGGIGAEQLVWLNDQITQAKEAGERVIVFAHHPVFPPNGANALNDTEILETLDASAGIVAFMNGHNHFGGVGMRRGVPYVTMPAILDGTTNAYAIANIYDDAFELIGYGRAQDVRIEFS